MRFVTPNAFALVAGAVLSCTPDRITRPHPNAAVVSVTPDSNLQQLINNAQAGDTIILSAGTYHVTVDTGFVFKNKTNLTVLGQGSATVIAIDSANNYGFFIRDNNNGLTISNLRIQGTPHFIDPESVVVVQTGIAPSGGSVHNRNIRLTDLEISDVAVGISVGAPGTPTSDCSDITTASSHHIVIARNLIRNIVGGKRASGIGIHLDNARQATVANNEIRDAPRHSIYQARCGDSVVIRENLILDHGRSHPYRERAAVVVARSAHVTVANNLFVNSYDHALSVEYVCDTESCGLPVDHIYLINNTFLGSRTASIWLNADTTGKEIVAWGNTFYHFNGVLDPDIGKSTNPWTYPLTPTSITSPSSWFSTQAIAEADSNYLFVMQNNVLCHVLAKYNTMPTSGWTYSCSSTQWTPDFRDIVSVDQAHIHSMQNSVLHFVTQGPAYAAWSYSPYSTGWNSFQSMAAVNGSLFVVSGSQNTLSRISPPVSISASVNLPAAAQGLAAAKGRLFLLSGNCIYEVNLSTLGRTQHDCSPHPAPPAPTGFGLSSMTSPYIGAGSNWYANATLTWSNPGSVTWEIYGASGYGGGAPPGNATLIGSGPSPSSSLVIQKLVGSSPAYWTYWIRFTNPTSPWAAPVYVEYPAH